MSRFSWWRSLALIGGLSLTGLLQAAEPARAPAVLFAGTGPAWAERPDEQHVKNLEAAGFVVDFCTASEVNWDRLQKYNVFVLYNLPNEDKGGNWPKEFAPLLDLIPRYVNAGGGFCSPGLCVSHGQTRSHELLLNRLEMSAPYERLYETDATRTYAMPTMFRQRFFLTQEIARNHPVTDGVQSLWCYFPHDGATLGEFPHPLVPKSAAWQVLAWGSPSMRSIRMPNFGEVTDETKEPAATYASKPPLVAARELGKGRVIVSTMNQSQLLENGWHFAYNGVCLKNGNGATPSDWEKLFFNAYRWLAEPSLAAGAPGGFKPAQSADQRAAASLQEQIQVGFERTKFGPPTGKHFKGLIGARTALSGGQGTVAEFVAAAKQAGYAWVVFTEAYDQMTEAKWQQLAAECAKATQLTGGADDFWAVAGLEYKDQCGNRFVSYGPNMGWIKPEWLGRKRFGVNEDVAVNFGFPDTILFELAQNKLDPHYIGHYYSIALETYRGREQKKSAFEMEQYARLQYLRYNLHPTALHFVSSPAEVATAAKTGFQVFAVANSLAEAPSLFIGPDAHYCHLKHPRCVYISEGPRLLAWQGSHTGLGARDRYLGGETIQHWEARLAVENDQPLREVKLLNGPDVLQRLLPKEAKGDFVFHGFHDRQYDLFATVEDAAGRRAVTSCLIVLELRNNLVNCTDNRNIITGGEYGQNIPAPRGFEMYFGRVNTGCLPPQPPILVGCREPLQALNPIADIYEYYACKDMVILDQFLKATWPPDLVAHGGKVNGYPEAVAMPLQDFDYLVRTYRFTTGKNNPELLMAECELKFKRDLTFPEKPARDLTVARLMGGRNTPTDFQAFAVGDAKAVQMQRRVAGDLAWAAEVKPGQYLTVVPGLTGAAAIIPLDQPLLWWGSINDKRFDLHAGIDLPPQVKTGDRFTARYAYAVGRFGEPLDSTEFPRLLAALGLSGTPAYQVTPDIGKVVDTKLFLTAAADSANGFSAKFTKADLPVDGLTIKLTGVNNRWSAAVWERDKKILNRAGGRDGALWANIALDTDRDVFIGNLLTCDSPDLRLIFLDGDQKACQYQVHNPTDQPITATVKSHPRFDKIKPVQKTLTIPPGTTVDVTE